MESKLNIRQALRVFHTVTSRGIERGGEWHLSGLRACTDFDGYTATIRNDYVTLEIFFHNKYRFNYNNTKERDLFLQKMVQIDQEYGN